MPEGKDWVRDFQRLYRSRQDRKRRRRILLSLSLLALAALAGFAWRGAAPSGPEAPMAEPGPAQTESVRPVAVAGRVQPGESFYLLMRGLGVAEAEILAMTGAARKLFGLRGLKAGKPYEIVFRPEGGPDRFDYEIDPHRRLVLSREPGRWSARIDPIEYAVRERTVGGEIRDSLYLSMEEECQSTALAVDLADIFAWDLDFSLDLRKGDRYAVLYEERWRGDRYAGPGRILAALVMNQGKIYRAVRYEDASGASDYYDPDGRSLQKRFLKSPLRYKYISSNFSRSRLHPVLKTRRPHLGVDYAAPHGTPVRAAADGRVVVVGRNGGMGKMVKIRHSGVYTTAYGHLSRYAKGIRAGKTVRQGEIIGYVGSTGLTTGPHLHYSFYKNGSLINPMRVENPRAKSIEPSELLRFRESARWLLERLERAAPGEPATTTAGSNSEVRPET